MMAAPLHLHVSYADDRCKPAAAPDYDDPLEFHDLNDDKEWSEVDLLDLRAAVGRGCSIEEAARFLCRIGTIDDVACKAEEMGLKVSPQRLRARLRNSHA